MGFLVAIQTFLETPEEDLDAGYSLLLHQDAWDQGSLCDAIAYLSFQWVQDEIVGLLMGMVLTSLRVERKHNQDKASELVKSCSLATCSRNSLLQRYQIKREQMIQKTMAEKSQAKKDLYMSYTALARRKEPELWSRSRGLLWWEADIDKASQAAIVHGGDAVARGAYLDDHWEELKTEAADLRRLGRNSLYARFDGGMPYTNAQWLNWLAENGKHFRELVKNASSKRRVFSERLLARLAMPLADRLQPGRRECILETWAQQMAQTKAGFHALLWGTEPKQRLVMFSCCLWRQSWGLPCRLLEGKTYVIDFGQLITEAFKPLAVLTSGLFEDVDQSRAEVHALTMRFESLDGLLFMMSVQK